MDFGQFFEKLMIVMPYWHYKIDRPFKQSHSERKVNMSLETYYCLQMLRREGPMTMSELARRLHSTKQQATRLIDTLCNYEFVKRTAAREDRRVVRIETTQIAVDYMEKYVYQDAVFLKDIERKLGKEDFEQLGEAIETLLRLLPRLE